MTRLRASGKIDADGRLHVEVPTQLPQGQVDVVVLIDANRPPNGRYDFSDVAGKLKWRGDALAQQRNLRNEW